MARTKAKCPNCGKVMKYLFELVYRNLETPAGKKSNMWNPKKRAIYCNNCDDIYKLDLEQELETLSTDISDLKRQTGQKFKV